MANLETLGAHQNIFPTVAHREAEVIVLGQTIRELLPHTTCGWIRCT